MCNLPHKVYSSIINHTRVRCTDLGTDVELLVCRTRIQQCEYLAPETENDDKDCDEISHPGLNTHYPIFLLFSTDEGVFNLFATFILNSLISITSFCKISTTTVIDCCKSNRKYLNKSTYQ